MLLLSEAAQNVLSENKKQEKLLLVVLYVLSGDALTQTETHSAELAFSPTLHMLC